MAQRFGGRFSPGDGTTPPAQGGYRGAKRTRVGGRVNMLFIAPLPLAFRAFTSGPAGLALNLAALGLLLLAAWLTREGCARKRHMRRAASPAAPPFRARFWAQCSLARGLALQTTRPRAA